MPLDSWPGAYRLPGPNTIPAVISSISGVTWPGLPTAMGTNMLALLYQLEQSQWSDSEVLRAKQFWQLEGLLRHAAKTVPFYRARLRAAGVNPAVPITPEAWARIPILSRSEVQTSFEALTSRRIPKSHGRISTITTSGSTGKPIKVLSTGLTGLMWRALTIRIHLWRRRDFSARLAAIRYDKGGRARYPDGARSASWGPSTAAIFATGPATLLSITTPVAQQAEWLERQDPDYLGTHPTNLADLVRHCQQEGIKLTRLREVETYGETLDPATRALCREEWGVPVADIYSAQELGYIALQCSDHEHYHVQSESALVEILDDQGRPCPPGGVGKVIVTHLHNFATPLIRYDLGDYAEVGEACVCGRGLPVLNRIMGRVRNMLTLPSGDRLWPFFRVSRFNDIAPISQFQFVQKTPQLIEVRLVVGRELSEGEEVELRELIVARLGYPFTLRFSYLDEIPRSASGKYEDFRSEIA